MTEIPKLTYNHPRESVYAFNALEECCEKDRDKETDFQILLTFAVSVLIVLLLVLIKTNLRCWRRRDTDQAPNVP